MNRGRRRAEKATWRVFADAVAVTVGFKTPLHDAALAAAKTASEDDQARFYELADELDDDAKRRFADRLTELDAKRHNVARSYANTGRV